MGTVFTAMAALRLTKLSATGKVRSHVAAGLLFAASLFASAPAEAASPGCDFIRGGAMNFALNPNPWVDHQQPSGIKNFAAGDIITMTFTGLGAGNPSAAYLRAIRWGVGTVTERNLQGPFNEPDTYTIQLEISSSEDLVVEVQVQGTFGQNGLVVTVSCTPGPDSLTLSGTRMAAQTSGQAMQGAIDKAIDDAFGDGNTLSGDATSFYMSMGAAPRAAAEPAPLDILALDRRSGGEDGDADRTFATLLGPNGAAHSADDLETVVSNWRVWTSVRHAWWNSAGSGDIRGGQTNLLAGATYIFTPDLAAGVFAGYETFEYSSQPLASRLAGSGWTGGAYLGWKFLPAYRFDIGLAGTALGYSTSAGVADGTFHGHRLFLTTGVTGSHTAGGFRIEPSAKLYALWERDGAFTDSTGAVQAARTFSTARLSGGLKVAHPFEAAGGFALEPFLGAYADYYVSRDSGAANLAIVDAVRDGWSARFTGGVSLSAASGVRASFTGEFGGIGQGGAPHGAIRADLSIPLN